LGSPLFGSEHYPDGEPWPIGDGAGHTVLLTYKEAKGDLTKLEMDIEAGDANHDVTVACGGLVAEIANKECTKPFLVITDQIATENFTSGQFCSGVDLNNRGRAVAGHDFLVSHYGVDSRRVWLIWNQMGHTGTKEKAEWKRRNWPERSVPVNDATKIAAAFQLAREGGATSVVVSADPFFIIDMDAVIKAANDKTGGQLYVCYPFTDYMASDNTHQPAPDYSMIYGPDLELAYKEIGRSIVGVVDALYWGRALPRGGLMRGINQGPIFITA
jgi:hypothetical protein